MANKVHTRVQPPADDSAVRDDDESTKQPQEYAAEEVAQELIDFLSRLSPFRIQRSLSDR